MASKPAGPLYCVVSAFPPPAWLLMAGPETTLQTQAAQLQLNRHRWMSHHKNWPKYTVVIKACGWCAAEQRQLFPSPWQQLRFHVSEQTPISICALCICARVRRAMKWGRAAQIKLEEKSKGSNAAVQSMCSELCEREQPNSLSVPHRRLSSGTWREMLTDGFCFYFHRRRHLPRFLICREFSSVFSVQKSL